MLLQAAGPDGGLRVTHLGAPPQEQQPRRRQQPAPQPPPAGKPAESAKAAAPALDAQPQFSFAPRRQAPTRQPRRPAPQQQWRPQQPPQEQDGDTTEGSEDEQPVQSRATRRRGDATSVLWQRPDQPAAERAGPTPEEVTTTGSMF